MGRVIGGCVVVAIETEATTVVVLVDDVLCDLCHRLGPSKMVSVMGRFGSAINMSDSTASSNCPSIGCGVVILCRPLPILSSSMLSRSSSERYRISANFMVMTEERTVNPRSGNNSLCVLGRMPRRVLVLVVLVVEDFVTVMIRSFVLTPGVWICPELRSTVPVALAAC